MNTSLLLQQCPVDMILLILRVFMMGGRWPYSCFFCGVLLPRLIQYCLQHSCVVAVKFFLHTFG